MRQRIVRARHIGLWVGAVALVVAAGGCALAHKHKAAPSKTSALVDFEIVFGNPPSVIAVPVTLLGREYPFIVDTGSSITIYDSTFLPHLGEPVDTQIAGMGAGPASLRMYSPPEAYLGHLRLETNGPVGCTDLSLVRAAVSRVSGQEVYGIVGMDFLRHYVLQLDLEERRLCLFEPGQGSFDEWGKRFDIAFQPEGVPTVTATLSDKIEASFLIDTGDASTGDLEAELFEGLRSQGAVEITGHATCATGSGYRQTPEGRLDRLALGPYSHEGLRLYKSHWNGLGLGYLAHYTVTFDFPDAAVYLKPKTVTCSVSPR